jgi:alpha-1,6-mannosyltransferase
VAAHRSRTARLSETALLKRTGLLSRTALLIAGGLLVEAGCAWIWVESPRLTAGYTADYTRAFFAALPQLTPLADPGEPLADPATMASWVVRGLVVMGLGYLVGLAAAEGAATWVVVGFAALFRLTLALLPGLFSTDVFSYVMYGRIAAVYGQNPYVAPPDAFPTDPLLAWVFPFWRDQPTVYGPLWTDVSALLAAATAGWSPFAQVSAARVGLLAFEGLSLVALWRLVGGRPRAWLLYAWNPLVLFDLVGATHNDGAMVALMLLGLVAIAAGTSAGWLVGLLLLACSALVKYATAVVVVVGAVAWSARGAARATGAWRLGLGLGLPLAIGVVAWWPWLQLPNALAPLEQAVGGRLVLNSVPDLLALTVADQLLVPGGMPVDAAHEAARGWVRAAVRVAFALYLLWELWTVWRAAEPAATFRRLVQASARLLLALPLVVFTWVWSWYFSWALALAALLGLESRLARLVVGYSLVAPPIVYAHQYLNDQLSGALVVCMAIAPLATLVGSEST